MPEDKRIIAVVIIGLYSSERIMIDLVDMADVNRIGKWAQDIEEQPHCREIFYRAVISEPRAEMYMNGQRHIKTYFFDWQRMESISITQTGDYESHKSKR